MFNKDLTAQVTAYFLWKEGGVAPYLKIMKLMYFAERLYLLKYGRRLTGDALFSMPQGPVLSQTLNLFQNGDEATSVWDEWISKEPGHCLGLKKKINRLEDFDQFNNPIKDILEHTYQEFGRYDRWELRDLSHTKKYCPEWHNPGNSNSPIPIMEILRRHGKTEAEANKIIDFLNEVESFEKFVGDPG